MTKQTDIKSFRRFYPATTSAVSTLMLRAAELRRSKSSKNWIDFNGQNLSECKFEQALSQVFDSAKNETGTSEPQVLLAFVTGFIKKFASISFGLETALEEFLQRRVSVDEIPYVLAHVPKYDTGRYMPAV